MAAAMQSALAADQISVGRARSLYILHCAGCHLMDGSGVPDKDVPSMRGAIGQFLNLPEGRAFLIQAPGARNSSLTDAELAAVTNWMLKDFSRDTLPLNYQPYTASEVSSYRNLYPLDIIGARKAIVDKVILK